MTEPLRPGGDPGSDPTTVSPTPVTPAAAAPPPPSTATAPVLQPPAAAVTAVQPRRQSPARWLAAAIVISLVVGVSAVATMALTGASSTATVMGYVPADTLAYAEVRLDLPGDQRRQVGEFLSTFPGFADQAALDTKLDEVLDQVVAEATDGSQTFTTDIKPWFDGEVAVAIGAPEGGAGQDGEKAGHGVALISIKDEALAKAWFADALAETGATSTTQTHDGTEITVVGDATVMAAQAAFAIVDGRVAVAGDLESVQAAIDAGGDSAFVDDPAVQTAIDATSGDDIGFAFIDTKAFIDQALSMAGPEASAIPTAAMLDLVPAWAAGRLRIESDALVIDGVMPHVEGAPGPDQNSANGVAAWAPPTTVVLAAGNAYGATLLESIERFRQDPTIGDAFTQIDGAANLLGGLDSALGWLGDTGLVVADGGDALEGGIVSIPTDPAAAQQFFTTIRSFATLAGGGAGITVTDTPYGDTTITTIDLGSAADLAGLAGGLTGGAVPSVPTDDLPEGDIQVAYAVTDEVVVIGSGPTFVQHVLDAGPGESLADTARYRDLIGRVGAEHTGVTFVDIAGLRGTLEGLMADASPEERAEYEESIQPFLAPFDALAAATTTGELDEQHAIITVK